MHKTTIYREKAERFLAQGATATNSKRPDQFIQGVYPEYLTGGKGPYVFDENGRRLVDFIGALGANLLGYNDPSVTASVFKQINTGYISGSLPTYLEAEVAEKIASMFHVERVRFLKTGNEATLAAVRIARNYSGKHVLYSHGYHGHGDLWTSLTPPSAGVSDLFNITKGNTDVGINGSYGAAILETLEIDDSEERRIEVKKLTDKFADNATPIIHDEIVSGCRVDKYCISNLWDLHTDILCLGKGIANGYPLAVVAGKKELMDKPEYFISSTFGGEAVSLAAANATLDILAKKNMKDFVYYAKRFQERLNTILKELDLEIKGYGTRGMFPTTKNENAALFMQEACKAGLLFGKAYFYSFAHMESGVEEFVLPIVEDVVNKIRKGGVKLEGQAPQETFKRFS